MVERVLSDDIIDILSDKEMETDILTEEEKIGNYKNLLSSGDTIHKATEQLLLKWPETVCWGTQKSGKSFGKLTVESDEKVKNIIEAVDARSST